MHLNTAGAFRRRKHLIPSRSDTFPRSTHLTLSQMLQLQFPADFSTSRESNPWSEQKRLRTNRSRTVDRASMAPQRLRLAKAPRHVLTLRKRLQYSCPESCSQGAALPSRPRLLPASQSAKTAISTTCDIGTRGFQGALTDFRRRIDIPYPPATVWLGSWIVAAF